MTETYDFIIVGAGSSGCVLANRLSADPKRRVLLIEAGPRDRSPFIRIPLAVYFVLGGAIDWQFKTEPEPGVDNRSMKAPRGKVLGGSSSINGMIYVRGHAEDFNDWERAGCEGWSYSGVRPYFRRSEHWNGEPSQERGATGPLQVVAGRYRTPLFDAFLRAGQEMGHAFLNDYNQGDHEGFNWVQYTQDHRRAKRCSSADAYLAPIKTRENLHIVTDAQVTGLQMQGRRCLGVQYREGGRQHQAHAGETILSAGAYMSPHLLMTSGIGPADELKQVGVEPIHNLAGVGRNLQDHVGSAIQVRCKRPSTYHSLKHPVRAAGALADYLFRGSGPISVFPMCTQAFLRSSESEPRPDLQMQFFPVSTDDQGRHATMNAYAITWGGMRPQSRGTVTLRSADPMAPPRIQHNFLTDPRDVAALVSGFKIARAINAQSAFDEYRGEEIDPGDAVQSDEEIAAYNRRALGSQYHPGGSCKMGVDDDAVVDPRLRVRGLENLRVVDASIMPTLTSGNTNGPAIMIGERGADLILGAL